MAKPQRDHGTIDARLQQLHSSAVPQHVRRDPLGLQRRTSLARDTDVTRRRARHLRARAHASWGFTFGSQMADRKNKRLSSERCRAINCEFLALRFDFTAIFTMGRRISKVTIATQAHIENITAGCRWPNWVRFAEQDEKRYGGNPGQSRPTVDDTARRSSRARLRQRAQLKRLDPSRGGPLNGVDDPNAQECQHLPRYDDYPLPRC